MRLKMRSRGENLSATSSLRTIALLRARSTSTKMATCCSTIGRTGRISLGRLLISALVPSG
nr:putative integron gene cassette protein [uncultured bacterium]